MRKTIYDTTQNSSITPFIFISYSRADSLLVKEVLDILSNNHFNYWYDHRNIKHGEKWPDEIGKNIAQCELFLVLISPNSVQSTYVYKEIRMAVKKNKKILVLYLTETNLPDGLELLLGDIHAIYKSHYELKQDFESNLCNSLPINALKKDEKDYFEENQEIVAPNGLTNKYQLLERIGNSSIDVLKEHHEQEAHNELTNKYQLLEKIGKGGLSDIYLARNIKANTLVAVKCGIIDRTFRGSTLKKCFYDEKEVLAKRSQLMCPYIPELIDWYEDESRVYLVESYISGESLNLHRHYSEAEIVDLGKKILNILKYLHSNNIIYRDLKPSNLIRSKYDEIYLIDFNSVLMKDNFPFKGNTVLGTVGFAPPEQFYRNAPTSFSSDIYALGRTMLYLLSPDNFDKNNSFPIRHYREDISVELEDVLMKMTSESPNDRYQDVEETLNALNNYKNIGFIKKMALLKKSKQNINSYVANHSNVDSLPEITMIEKLGLHTTVLMPISDYMVPTDS